MAHIMHDHYFAMGSSHAIAGIPCEDYATAGMLGDIGFAIVSDGCSSGEDTDIGSRLTAIAARNALARFIEGGGDIASEDAARKIVRTQRDGLLTAQKALGLPRESMFATSLILAAGDRAGLVSVQGDGVIATMEESGTLTASKFEWNGNAPFYPAYADDSYASFLSHHGGEDAAALSHETWALSPGASKWELLFDEKLSVSQGIRGISVPLKLPTLRYAGIFSDGAVQIDKIDWKEAVREMMTYKVATGEFVTRRIKRFLADAKKLGEGNVDDIAGAVLRFAPQ